MPPSLRHTVLLTALLLPSAAAAGIMGWEKLADDPDSYIGKPVEVLGYCAQGDADGYQCSTEGDLYIVTPEIKPRVRQEEDRGELRRHGRDRAELVLPRQDQLHAGISLDLDHAQPGKTVTVISADIATLKF